MNAYCIVMCIHADTLNIHMYLCPCTYNTKSLHPPSCSIVRYDFCLTILCYLLIFSLSSFALFTDLLLCLFKSAATLLLLHGNIFSQVMMKFHGVDVNMSINQKFKSP